MLSLVVVFLLCVNLGGSVTQQGTTYCTNSIPVTCIVKLGVVDPKGSAFGTFDDDLAVTGWGKLKLQTSADPNVTDLTKMYAIGYLEGVLTKERIQQQIDNMYAILFPDPVPPVKIIEWMGQQEDWTRSNIANDFGKLNPTWQQVAMVMSQYDGIQAGFSASSSEKELQDLAVPIQFAFQMLSGWGDILDLSVALSESQPEWEKMTDEEKNRELSMRGHCSALIKVLGDFSDIFMAHSSWFDYSAMNRIYKHYFFDVSAKSTVAKKVSFSSYPGCLVSIDDFYLMDSGIVMLQTTNAIINTTVYGLINPYALLAWQRVRIANTMSNDGQTWMNIISNYNSGTYNNQYMVLDLKKFHPGSGIDDGALWVAEQIPGLVATGDETNILRYGYWPSYNVPFFDNIWKISGYNLLGPNYTHTIVPRAEIFRRDQGSVVDMNSFKNIMRSNNYKTDPYSKGDPGKAICSRFDLETKSPSAGGCYDTKVTSYSLAISLISEAINGPTTENLPPFSWTGEFAQKTHEGIPTTMNFDFEVMDPKW
jgi:hypothetical protein